MSLNIDDVIAMNGKAELLGLAGLAGKVRQLKKTEKQAKKSSGEASEVYSAAQEKTQKALEKKQERLQKKVSRAQEQGREGKKYARRLEDVRTDLESYYGDAMGTPPSDVALTPRGTPQGRRGPRRRPTNPVAPQNEVPGLPVPVDPYTGDDALPIAAPSYGGGGGGGGGYGDETYAEPAVMPVPGVGETVQRIFSSHGLLLVAGAGVAAYLFLNRKRR
jgi:hypothetical protein